MRAGAVGKMRQICHTPGMASSPHDALRAQARRLLDERAPADALAVYYALYADPATTALFIHTAPDGAPHGLLVRARTGMDLFRPLVTVRAVNEAAFAALCRAGLPARRPVYLTVPESHAGWANKHLQMSDMALYDIYALTAANHRPVLNVLTRLGRDAQGRPRAEIRAGDHVGAVAGVNWLSPRFAEVFVQVHPAAQGRGWGKSVVSAVCAHVLAEGRTPLYVVAEQNTASQALAASVGFERTGQREYIGQAALLEATQP